jgi:drug/metabolite transporter (DMT)-like permease
VKHIAFRPDAADGMMLAVVLMWAANNILIKNTVRELPALPFVVARSAIVFVLVWSWLALRRQSARIARRDVPLFILTGICGFGVYNALFTIGMERTSAFSVSLLMSISPIFTLLLARFLGIERPSAAQWLAVLLAAAGVTLFVGDKMRAQGFGVATTGDLLGLSAAILFAIYSLAARPLTTRYGAALTNAWAVSFGLVAIAPWGLPASLQQPWGNVSLPVWGSLFYASAVSMLIGYALWSWAIARGGMARTVPYLFLIPVVTGVVSAVAFGEVFGPLKLAGAAMALAGTTLVRILARGMSVPQPAPTADLASSAEASGVRAIVIAGGRSGD